MFLALRRVQVAASDFARSRRFYGEILGLVEAGGFEKDWVEFGLGPVIIRVVPLRPGEVSSKNQVSLILSTTSIDKTLSHLKEKGVTVSRAPHEEFTGRFAEILDPDGYRIIVYQPSELHPDEEWVPLSRVDDIVREKAEVPQAVRKKTPVEKQREAIKKAREKEKLKAQKAREAEQKRRERERLRIQKARDAEKRAREREKLRLIKEKEAEKKARERERERALREKEAHKKRREKERAAALKAKERARKAVARERNGREKPREKVREKVRERTAKEKPKSGRGPGRPRKDRSLLGGPPAQGGPVG